ncbi:MAG: hypothetical protein Q9183_007747, partial [Haloplaca sp. 2 TL-2023]
MSAFVGRFRPGHQKSLTARLTSPISPIPLNEADERGGSISTRSVSLPGSPNRANFPRGTPGHRLTLSGANLQSRLEYPLPPPPEDNGTTTPTTSDASETSRRRDANQARNDAPEIVAIPNLPSATQLANLHNRYCVTASPPSTQATPPVIRTSAEGATPRPPRAALGAAGTAATAMSERRRLSVSQRNSFAASSPALLRPTPQRLETIQSISSVLSQNPNRSNSRGVEAGGRRLRRRSRSAGPAARNKNSEDKRNWFGGKKNKKSKTEPAPAAAQGEGGYSSAYLENSRMLNERYGVDGCPEKDKS